MMAFPTPRWLSTHRRQLHLLLYGGRCWDSFLALPHHPSRPPANEHGRAASCAPTTGPGAVRREPLYLFRVPERSRPADRRGCGSLHQYPLQMHGFDPNFHFVGMTFNPEMFVDMKGHTFPAQRAELPLIRSRPVHRPRFRRMGRCTTRSQCSPSSYSVGKNERTEARSGRSNLAFSMRNGCQTAARLVLPFPLSWNYERSPSLTKGKEREPLGFYTAPS